MIKSEYKIGSEPFHAWEENHPDTQWIVFSGDCSAETFTQLCKDFDYTKYLRITLKDIHVQDHIYYNGETVAYEVFWSYRIMDLGPQLYVLQKLLFADDHEFIIIENAVYSFDLKTLYHVIENHEITIANGIEHIGNYAFANYNHCMHMERKYDSKRNIEKAFLLIALVCITAISLSSCKQQATDTGDVNTDSTVVYTSSDLHFLQGIKNPEDLLILPGGRWAVVSGTSPNSGIHLADLKHKTAEQWIAPAAKPIALFAQSKSQPDPTCSQTHGIALRNLGNGRLWMYAINHRKADPITDQSQSDDETIEVFEIDNNGEKPQLKWLGNIPMIHPLYCNSMTVGSDGSVYVTVMLHPGTTLADFWGSKHTGAVYRWQPGDEGFTKMVGTERVGNNGIEISPNGKTLYVAHIDSVSSFTNTIPAKRIAGTWLKDCFVDNIHYVEGKLYCAGTRFVGYPATGYDFQYMKGWHITLLDEHDLAPTRLWEGDASEGQPEVSTGIPTDTALWLGSPHAEGIYWVSRK